MKYVFTHGPGFSSRPEELILKPEMKSRGVDLVCWNGPLRMQPEVRHIHDSDENAFDCMIKDLTETLQEEKAKTEGRLGVIAHSYSAISLLYILQNNPDIVDEIILVAPALLDESIDDSIFDIAENGFLETGSTEQLNKMRDMRSSLTVGFDEHRLAIFGLAAEYPELFPACWRNKRKMGEYFQYFADVRCAFNVDVFARVRLSSPVVDLSFIKGEVDLPAKIFLGKHDPVIDKNLVLELMYRYFPRAALRVLPESGHYPHIEEMNSFLDYLIP